MYIPDYQPPNKVGKLTEEEMAEFLAQPWNARLATVTAENTPYIVPLWYAYDPGERVFYIIARERSKYVPHILRNPAVALQVADDAHLEHTRVLVEGIAEILTGPIPPGESQAMLEIATRMSQRYMGEEGAAYVERTKSQPRYLIKITPRRWSSWTGREWASHYRKE